MPSLHPLTRVINSIENEHIKRALLDRLGGNQPNTLSTDEIGGFFHAGAENDRSVKGHDMTESELRDYVRIHAEGGAYLFRAPGASKMYAAELRKYTGLPKVEIVETDPGLGTRSKIALNKAELSGVANGNLCPSGVMCVIGGPTSASLKVDGETFSVEPRAGEGHQSVAKRLGAEVEAAGFKVKVHTTRTKSTIEVKGRKTLELASLTTDRAVRMGVQGNQITVDVGIGAGLDLAGGRVGISIGGKSYTQATTAGEPASIALTQLRRQIEIAGFEVTVASLPTIDTIHELWSLKPLTRPWVDNHSYPTLSGTVRIEGDTRWLDLDKEIRVDNNVIKSLQLKMGSDVRAGAATVSGRIEVKEGETFPTTITASMSGITNVGAGEPAFDGKTFTNQFGKECVSRYLPQDRNGPTDVPARIFVFDQSSDTAFLGRQGGMPTPFNDFNAFYGFDARRAIDVSPSRADLAAVQFKVVNDTGRAREEWPHSRATGQPLLEMQGADMPATVEGRRYFMDRQTEAVYIFDITGPTERTLLQVVKKDPRDV